MFQFPACPPTNYVFICRWQAVNLPGFPIQKSTDLGLLAAPRSLSQLATSFVGVWCHGIHPVLLLAWFFRRLILRPIVSLHWNIQSSDCHYSVLQLAFILNHSCAVVKVQAVRQDCIQVLFPNPESDTDSNAIFNSFRCDAARLLTFLVGIQLAHQLCCHALSGLSPAYGRLSVFRRSFVSTIGWSLLISQLACSLERRWSSRTFRYGYLVTTSPQSLVLP